MDTYSYIIRVVLYGADADTYERLHEVMLLRDARREITDNGVTYELPDAEYFRKTASDIQTVLQETMALADSVHANNSVLVSKADAIAWLLPKKK